MIHTGYHGRLQRPRSLRSPIVADLTIVCPSALARFRSVTIAELLEAPDSSALGCCCRHSQMNPCRGGARDRAARQREGALSE